MVAKVFSVGDLIAFLGKDLLSMLGAESSVFNHVASLNEASSDSLTFCSKKDASAQLFIQQSQASIILTYPLEFNDSANFNDKAILMVGNPRLVFIRAIKHFFSNKLSIGAMRIHPTAVISSEANIHSTVQIGPYSVIGNCQLGENTIIDSHVTINDDVTIGKNVFISSNTVIGKDGFGYEKNEIGCYEKFPHIGNVIIEDNVEIGGNCSIDKGTLGSLKIGQGTKIDNHVHIAHNAQIGKHVMITAGVTFSGSVTVGDYVWIAPSAVLMNKITIGDNAFIGIGSVVVRDVESNKVVFGNPAKVIKNRE